MKSQLRFARRIGTVMVIAALLAMSAGCALTRSASRDSQSESGGVASYGSGEIAPMPPADAGQPASAEQNASKSASTVSPDRMIVSTASMNIQVDDVDKQLAAVRALAAATGSQITQLSVQAGDSGGPMPLGEGSVSPDSQSSSAQITLRVPAAKLASVQEQAAKLGKVLTQTASEDDVTQQHVDLTARLRNLQAEEVRLRSFLDKAVKVSEMLEVERELSRVRGEIESMQAQIAYLDQQTAMATLALSLTAPGSLVQPEGGTWGFAAAVTKGVQAAAALLGVLIIVTIALAPVWLVVIVIILVVRARRRRRLAAQALAEDDLAVAPEPEAEPAPPAE